MKMHVAERRVAFCLVHWTSDFHALISMDMTVEYTAGFGLTTADIPADLSEALMDQAALHYDGRSPMDARGPSASPHIAWVSARYRGVAL
ncbi:hypothetical protein [Pseudaestuariivita rosea]|uniref:hypothetical protein n=1 Tax=Pseudaestuariivita rosea TaxID=2763263 RepID=UPI001ABB7CC7|nr:hypothetical protein [Pseudaestuariivita rosea]